MRVRFSRGGGHIEGPAAYTLQLHSAPMGPQSLHAGKGERGGGGAGGTETWRESLPCNLPQDPWLCCFSLQRLFNFAALSSLDNGVGAENNV